MKNKSLAVLLGITIICSTLQPAAGYIYAADSNTPESNGQDQWMDGQQPPQMPDGQAPGMDGQQPSQKPDGQAPDGAGDPGEMNASGGMGGPGGSSPAEGQIGSWNGGASEDYDYDSALYIQDGAIAEDKSSSDRLESGTYDDTHADSVVLNDSQSHHEGIVILDSDYTISNANIAMHTAANGSDTCDFSGVGSAVAAFGNSDVTIEDSSIETSGVATMPVFADDGATVTVRNSKLVSNGGTLHSAYLNTPDQGNMVAPPWILGIMGNSRCSNLMGTNTTMNVIDSETSAGAWAVLSVDAGNNMALNIVNTTLTLTNADESASAPLQEVDGQIYETLDNPYTVNYGSGYGTYAIGKVNELFAGATLNVGTYGTIFTGGSARYTSLSDGESISLPQADGSAMEYITYHDQASQIHSDTFGFMAHQDANSIIIEKETVVESGFDTFLVKTGSSSEALQACIDNASITNGGVMIQVMDNDDATNGGMMATDAAENTNGGSRNFIPVHEENPGFNTAEASAASEIQQFCFSNGEYSGNIYNASGSDASVHGALNGSALNVTFGANTTYSGAAASTAAIHVTYDGAVKVKENGGYAFDSEEAANAFAEKYQNVSFDITHYFDLGHVANLIHSNGSNNVSISLTDNAIWNVTGTSLIQSLSIEGDARVVVPEGITLTVGENEYTSCTLTADML